MSPVSRSIENFNSLFTTNMALKELSEIQVRAMREGFLMKEKDRVLMKTKQVVLDIAEKYGLKTLSIILYGSRACGDYSFDSDYDFFVLLDNDTSLRQFTQFISELRLELYRVGSVKLYSNTVENFKYIMSNNPFLGSFCYIIATEGVPLYDEHGVFKGLHEEVENLTVPEKITFVKKCLAMSKTLGSPRWVKYWRKRLRDLKELMSVKHVSCINEGF